MMKRFFISYYTNDGDDDEAVVSAVTKERAVEIIKIHHPDICEIQDIQEI